MAPKDKSNAGGKSAIDKELIRELAKLLDETGLTEIEIERAGLRVRVGRATGNNGGRGGGGPANFPKTPQPQPAGRSPPGSPAPAGSAAPRGSPSIRPPMPTPCMSGSPTRASVSARRRRRTATST